TYTSSSRAIRLGVAFHSFRNENEAQALNHASATPAEIVEAIGHCRLRLQFVREQQTTNLGVRGQISSGAPLSFNSRVLHPPPGQLPSSNPPVNPRRKHRPAPMKRLLRPLSPPPALRSSVHPSLHPRSSNYTATTIPITPLRTTEVRINVVTLALDLRSVLKA